MTKFLKKIKFLALFTAFKVSGVLAAGTGDTGETPVTLENPLKSDSIVGVLKAISDFLIVIGAPLLVIFVIIGGFQILTAAGNPEKINTGKKTILYASIGYAIVFSAWGIISIIKQTLGVKK